MTEDWSHYLILAQKQFRNAEAAATIHLWQEARAAMESIKGLMVQAQAATHMIENAAIELRYKQRGMNVKVTKNVDEALMLEFIEEKE